GGPRLGGDQAVVGARDVRDAVEHVGAVRLLGGHALAEGGGVDGSSDDARGRVDAGDFVGGPDVGPHLRAVRAVDAFELVEVGDGVAGGGGLGLAQRVEGDGVAEGEGAGTVGHDELVLEGAEAPPLGVVFRAVRFFEGGGVARDGRVLLPRQLPDGVAGAGDALAEELLRQVVPVYVAGIVAPVRHAVDGGLPALARPHEKRPVVVDFEALREGGIVPRVLRHDLHRQQLRRDGVRRGGIGALDPTLGPALGGGGGR